MAAGTLMSCARRCPPGRRARNAAATKAILAELPLQELRHARELTQATLAETMECGQDEISKLERRADMLVSTLRRYVEAMGGQLARLRPPCGPRDNIPSGTQMSPLLQQL